MYIALICSFICFYQHEPRKLTLDTVHTGSFTHNKCYAAKNSLFFPFLLTAGQITCPNIAAYFRATYYIPLMNSTRIAEWAEAVCAGSFFIEHTGTIFFFLNFQPRWMSGGTRLWSSFQPASQPRSSLLCFLRPCQPAADPSPSADLPPSDTLGGALWCAVCSNVQ